MKQASKITRQSPVGTDSWKRIRRERERAFRFLVAIFATTSLLAFMHSRIWAHEVGAASGAAADLEPLLQSTRLHPTTGEHSLKGRDDTDCGYCGIASFRGQI